MADWVGVDMDEATPSAAAGDRPPRHSLSNIDKTALVADCAVCGPSVRIGLRATGVARCIKGTTESRRRTRNKELHRARGRQYRAGATEEQRRARNQAASQANRRRQEGMTDEQRRAERLRHKYGIPPGQYERMYDGVNGKCEICMAPHDLLYVDHDHLTGIVRGLLCRRCNCAIGFLGDSARLAMAASRYLRRTTGLIF